MSKVANGNYKSAKDLFTDLCFSQFAGLYDTVDTTDILPGSAKLNIKKTNNEKSDASPAYSLAQKIMKQQLVVFFTELGVITTPYAESLLMRETETDELSDPEKALLDFVRQTNKHNPQPLKMYTQTTTSGFTSSEEVTVKEYIEQCLLNFGKDKNVEQHKAKLEETLTPILGFPTKPDGLNTEWGAFYLRAQTVEYFGSEKNYNLALYEVLIQNMPCNSVPMEVNYYIYNTLTNPSFGFIASFQNAAKSKTPMKIQLTFDRELVFPYTFKLKVVSQKKEITVLQDKGKKLEEIYDVGDSNGTRVNNRDENNASVALGFGGKKIVVAKLKMAYTQKLEDFAKVVYWPIVTSYLDMNSVSEADVQSVIESSETGSIKISTSVNNNVCNEISNFEIEQYYKFHDCKNTERNMYVNAAFGGYYTLEARLRAVSVGSLMKKQSEFEYFQNYDNEICVFSVDSVDDEWLTFQSTMEISSNKSGIFDDIVETSHTDFARLHAQDLSQYYNTFPEIEVDAARILAPTAIKYLNQIRETKTLVASELQLTEIEDNALTFQSVNFISIPMPGDHPLVTPNKQYRIDFLRKTIAFKSYAFFSHQTYFSYFDPLNIEGQLTNVRTGSNKFELKQGNTTLILDMLKGTTEIVNTDDPTVLVEQLWRCWLTNYEEKTKFLFREVLKVLTNMQASFAAFFGTILARDNPFDNPADFLNGMALPPDVLGPIMSGYGRTRWPFLAMLAWASPIVENPQKQLSEELNILYGYVYHSVCLFFKVYETICAMWEEIRESFPPKQQEKIYNDCMQKTLFKTWMPFFGKPKNYKFFGTIQCDVFDYNVLYSGGDATNEKLKAAVIATASHPAEALQNWASQVALPDQVKAAPALREACELLKSFLTSTEATERFTEFKDFIPDGRAFIEEFKAHNTAAATKIENVFKVPEDVAMRNENPETLLIRFKSRDHALKSETEVVKAFFTRKTRQARKEFYVKNTGRKLDKKAQAAGPRNVIMANKIAKKPISGTSAKAPKILKRTQPSGAAGGGGGGAPAALISNITGYPGGLTAYLSFKKGTELKTEIRTDGTYFYVKEVNDVAKEAGLLDSRILQVQYHNLTQDNYKKINFTYQFKKEYIVSVWLLRQETLDTLKLKYIRWRDFAQEPIFKYIVTNIEITIDSLDEQKELSDCFMNQSLKDVNLQECIALCKSYLTMLGENADAANLTSCLELYNELYIDYVRKVIPDLVAPEEIGLLINNAIDNNFEYTIEQIRGEFLASLPRLPRTASGFANTTELEISEGSSPKNGVTDILRNFQTFSLINGNSSSESDGEDDSGSEKEKKENSAPADIVATSDSGSDSEKEENSAPADIASSDLGSDSEEEEESITAADLEEEKEEEADDNVAAPDGATGENQFTMFAKPRNDSSSSSGSDSEKD